MIGLVLLVASCYLGAMRTCRWLINLLEVVKEMYKGYETPAVCMQGPMDGYEFDWDKEQPPDCMPYGVYLHTDEKDPHERNRFYWTLAEEARRHGILR